MQSTPNESGRPMIVARPEKLLLITRVLGCESNEARAALLDVSPRTIYNALRRRPVSDEVVAKTIVTMRSKRAELESLGISASFDEVFEIIGQAA